jgi:hypothetical protein
MSNWIALGATVITLVVMLLRDVRVSGRRAEQQDANTRDIKVLKEDSKEHGQRISTIEGHLGIER